MTGQDRQDRGLRTVVVDGREAVDGEVLVRFRTTPGGAEEVRAAADVEPDEVETIGRRGLRRWRTRRLGTRALLERMRANPDVEFVEPNYVIRIDAVPNDPWFGNLWGLFNSGQNVNGSTGVAGADIDAPLAWELSTGSRANVVGIVDTGIDYNHPDLSANIWTAPSAFSVTVGGVVINCAAGTHGFNAITNTCNPMDDHSHGTHVAGTIGAVGNNGVGITGVSWTASMMGLKFLSASGSGSTSNAIKAIEFAVQAKAVFAGTGGANVRVLSNSWGGGGFSQALLDAINLANTADMLFVAAAGNSASDNDVIPNYPSNYTAANVLAVAATTSRDQRSSFSSYGATTVDLGAPGSTILSTTPNNTYSYFNGTSMATPHVSGAAALLLSYCSLNTAALKSALMAAVDPIAAMAGITATGGRLNVNNAIRVCPPLRRPVPAISSIAPFRAAVGGPAFSMTVTGTGFVSTSEVRLDGATRSTTYVNATTLTATVLASDLASIGTRAITVFTPSPGGGTSAQSTLTVTPPVGMMVNGASGPLTVTTGAALSVVVTNGPANSWDYVTVVPAGSPDDFWSGAYRFLNDTTVAPSQGLTDATVNLTAPTTPGTYEVRFLAAGWFTRLATSGVITAVTPNPVPTLTAVTPGSVVAGASSFGFSVSGTGFTATSQVRVNGSARSTTYASPTSLTATITSADIASVGTVGITVFNPSPGGGTSGSAPLSVVAPPAVPVLTSISPTTIAAGGGPFTLIATGANFTTNSQVTINGVPRQAVFISSTSLTATLPASDRATAGSHAIRVFTPAPGGGTSGSAALTVQAATLTVNGSSGAITVQAGSTLSVAITNGPANSWDYVTVVPVGSPATIWTGTYRFLNGTTSAPNPGLSSATVTLSAPSTTGLYEVRFNADGWYTRLATSGVITVGTLNPAPLPAPGLTVNGTTGPVTVTSGSPLSVVVSNGPGNSWDYLTLVPVGSPADTWSGNYRFLNGTTTPPNPGLTSATVSYPAPTTPGQYELRFNADGWYTRLATSGVITVSAPAPSGASMTVNGTTSPITVANGSTLTVSVTNGPGNQWDYVTIVPAGSPADTWSGIYRFLDDTTTAPSTGMTSGTVHLPAPTTPGSYEVRFNADGWYARLATSATIIFTP